MQQTLYGKHGCVWEVRRSEIESIFFQNPLFSGIIVYFRKINIDIFSYDYTRNPISSKISQNKITSADATLRTSNLTLCGRMSSPVLKIISYIYLLHPRALYIILLLEETVFFGIGNQCGKFIYFIQRNNEEAKPNPPVGFKIC